MNEADMKKLAEEIARETWLVPSVWAPVIEAILARYVPVSEERGPENWPVCTHDISERDTAIADGLCPICLLARVKAQAVLLRVTQPRATLEELREERLQAELDELAKDSVK